MAVSTAEGLRTRAFPQIRWSAVIAGALLALATHVVLGLIGAALGFAAEPADSEGLGIGAGIWALLTPLVASLLGAWLAVKLSDVDDDRGAMTHGVLVWCIGLIAGALFLTGTAASSAMSAGAASSGNLGAAQRQMGAQGQSQRGTAARNEARADEAGEKAAKGTGAAALGALLGLGGAFAGSALARRDRRGRGRALGARDREYVAAERVSTTTSVGSREGQVVEPPVRHPGPGDPLHH